MNEWAARIMSVFPERNKAELEEFIQQVSHEQSEHMYFQKEYIADIECRPTFEQLSHDRIVNEANKNINVLKSLENIVGDRMVGYNVLHNTLSKTAGSYELLENVDGTLKIALDSLFMFTEQEVQQAKQHVFLGDLKKSLNEMRTDAIRRIADYQKEITAAEKEVTSAEKRLYKTKEALDRSLDYRSKMESFELDVIVNTSRPVLGFGNNQNHKDTSTSRASKDSTGSSSRGEGGSMTGAEDSVMRIERELREDIRVLLRTIEHRDNVLAASRRAFQKLYRDCRKVAQLTVLKIAEKEQEQAEQRAVVLAKLQSSIKAVSIDIDEREFIEAYSGSDGALTLNSQALSLLNDLAPPPLPESMDVHSHGTGLRPGMYTYAEPMVDARSRSASPLVRRTDSFNSLNKAHAGTPISPSSSQQTSSSQAGRGLPATPTRSNVGAGSQPPSPAPSSSSSSRFSFRRTLGLTSSSSSHNSSAPALVAPPATPAGVLASATSTASTASSETQQRPAGSTMPSATHSFPSTAVVAAGRVGGSDGSADHRSHSPINSEEFKEKFSAYLTQIFYSPGATASHDANLLLKGRRFKSDPGMFKVKQSDASAGVGEEELIFEPPCDQVSSPVTPKIMVDEEYFYVPEEHQQQEQELQQETAEESARNNNKNKSNNNKQGEQGQSSAKGNRSRTSSKHEESLSFAKRPVYDPHSDSDSPGTTQRKEAHRGAKVTKTDYHCSALDWLKGNPHSCLIDAVEGICRAIKTLPGRNAFTTELNQFRSKKVEVGDGFQALGAVLWTALSHCQAENDVHNASVIMMLSQTFYKRISRNSSAATPTAAEPVPVAVDDDPSTARAVAVASTGTSTTTATATATNNSNNSSGVNRTTTVKNTTRESGTHDSDDDDDEESDGARGAENRQYLKELLLAHPIWRDGNYWEQTLWQCAIEQLQTIPYDRAWHDMPRDVRKEAVRRVHEVIFSQVMAVTHSMMEMGCSAEQSREFLYRMCVIHQLNESMRHSLLKHVSATSSANSRRMSRRGSEGRRPSAKIDTSLTFNASNNSNATNLMNTMNVGGVLPPSASVKPKKSNSEPVLGELGVLPENMERAVSPVVSVVSV